MKNLSLTTAIFSIVLLCGSRAPAGDRHVVIAGYIGDSMCGLRHGRAATTPAEERECTIQCVHDGSKFILADRTARKVYQLEDQDSPRAFAGKKVRVTGEIDGQSVRVETIQPAE